MKLIHKVGIAAASTLALLTVVLGTNTLLHRSRQIDVAAVPASDIDADRAAQRLAQAVRFRTVASATDPQTNLSEFLQLHAYLERQFPLVHASLKRELVGTASLLYTWQGSDASMAPALWVAHQDVVPADHDETWSLDPFVGAVKDGYIWGRGSWDDKGGLMAQMEAIEALLAKGYRPKRTLYLAYGRDEELGGAGGAKTIAALLQSRKLRFDYLLDEGMVVTEGLLRGFDAPVAMVGIAEKGYMTLRLSTTAKSGHSSMPPAQMAIGRLSKALSRLEQHPMPARLDGAALEMFETLAPEASGVSRVLLSNLWLTRPLLESQLSKTPLTNALMRTTTALTVVRAGEKDNVLPSSAEALVNFRLLPGNKPEDVAAYVKSVVGDDIQVQPLRAPESASGISRTDVPAYAAIHRSIKEAMPGVIVVPGLVVGGTDSKHYEHLAENIYRFRPVRVGPNDTTRIHGGDERVSVKNYAEMVFFFQRVLMNTSGADFTVPVIPFDSKASMQAPQGTSQATPRAATPGRAASQPAVK
jgi:carboxypeptidase PM20D1